MILRPASVAILAAASVAAVAAQGAIRPEWVAAVHVAPRLPASGEAEVPAGDDPEPNDAPDSPVEEDEDSADADAHDGEGDSDGDSARSWTATLSLRSGYDSNYDEDDPARGSGFVEGAAGIFGTARIGDFDTEFEADATYLRAPGVSVSRVTDATLAASATRRWSETVSGMLGGSAEIDFEEDPAAFTAEAHAEIAHATDGGRVALRGGVERERPWRARAVLSEDGDDYQPKYWAALLRIEADGPAEATLAPYGRLELARLHHDRRRSVRIDDADFIPGSSRDGWRTRMSGGLAWRPVESLTLRGGLALARRSFDGGGWRTAHFVSPEFSAEWSPAEDMRLSLSYERAFGESDEFDALAEDVSTAAFGFAYEPDAGFGFSAEASRERSRRIGDGADATEYAAELVASYRFSDHLTLEGGVELAASFDDDGSEEYRRARAFIGATAEY